MHVAIVSQYFWPEAFFINDAAYGLRDRGHRVTVLTGLPNYPAGTFDPGYSLAGPFAEQHEGIDILRAPIAPRGRSGPGRLALNFASFAFSASVRARWSRRIDHPDVVLSFLPSPLTSVLPAMRLAQRFDAPLALWVQDLWPESLELAGHRTGSIAWRFADRLARKAYRRSAVVMVASEAYRAPVEARLSGPTPIVHVPNGVMGEPGIGWTPSPDEIRPEANVPFRIVYGGNVGDAQGFETLLDAACRTHGSPIRWSVVGDGRRMAWLAAEVARLGIGNIDLVERQSQEEARNLFQAADALLVMLRATPVFSLTVPSKLQTYLSCGRPILASLDGETARIVRDAGCGYAVPAEDGAALAETALRLAALPVPARNAMGQAARELFDSAYRTETIVDRLEQALFAAAASRKDRQS